MRLFGREAHPVALALTLSAAAVTVGWLLRPDPDPWRIASAGYAAAVAVLLTVAWALNRREWTRGAMLLSLGLWVYQAGVAAWVIDSPTSVLLALTWAVLAGGSYVLEVSRGASRSRTPSV